MNCTCDACQCEPVQRYSEADASRDYSEPTDAQLTALDSAIATLDATETLREQSWYHRGFAEGLVYAADYLDDQI